MQLKFSIKNVAAQEATLEGLNFEVEYSIEEFTAMMEAYPKLMDQLIQGLNALNKGE